MNASLVAWTVAVGLTLGSSIAVAQPEKSLEKCQKTVGKEISKYISSKQKAIAKCLDKVAKLRIRNAENDAAAAAKSCAGALRKIVNTDDPTKTLAAKTRDKIEKVCDTAHPKFGGEHVDADILGNGAEGVAGDAINASPQLTIPCLGFGGDGTFDTSTEWLDCLIASADAKAIGLIHTQYPNADAWVRDVRPDIIALGDDQKYVDAAAAALSVRRWVDNGDGTVTDYVTGLMWERKDDSGGIHDVDDTYTWSASSTDPDGTTFTTFLDTLNGGATGVGDCNAGSTNHVSLNGGFAGHCDWRLPTLAELRTILLEPSICARRPCIAENVFGPTAERGYWSVTSGSAAFPTSAWVVDFQFAGLYSDPKTNGHRVRAVRGGF